MKKLIFLLTIIFLTTTSFAVVHKRVNRSHQPHRQYIQKRQIRSFPRKRSNVKPIRPSVKPIRPSVKPTIKPVRPKSRVIRKQRINRHHKVYTSRRYYKYYEKPYHFHMRTFFGSNWWWYFDCRKVWFRPSFNAIGYTCYFNHRMVGSYTKVYNYYYYQDYINVVVDGYYFDDVKKVWIVYGNNGMQFMYKNDSYEFALPTTLTLSGFYIDGNYIFF